VADSTAGLPKQPWTRRLYLPAYAVAEAARYAGTPPNTVAYWHYWGGGLGPLLPGKERGKPLTYFQLIEVAFVATFRRLGVSLQRIRKARDYLGTHFDSEYPFADFRLQTEGHHILLDLRQIEDDAELGRLVFADVAGQEGWQPLVGERFAEFDYEYGVALVWHVAGRSSPVLIDPRVSFGAPTVRGIPTWVIKGRWEAQEGIDEIVEDFRLEQEEVKGALRFEGIQLAA